MADRMVTAERARQRGEPPLRQAPDGRMTKYTGSRAQLIAAGVIDESTILPGDPGTPRKGYLVYPEGHPRRLDRAWASTPGRYTLTVKPTAEKLLEIVAQERRRDEKYRFEAARREHAKKVAGWPTSHEAFRESSRTWVRWGESAFNLALGDGGDGGYSFDADTRDAVQVLVQRIRGLLAEGRTVFDPAERDRLVREGLAKVAHQDADFGAFLDRAKAAGSGEAA